MPNADKWLEGTGRALSLLKSATTPHGILASTEETDNYCRIWARDGIICGLAGLLVKDEVLTNGLKSTLITLAKHQGPEGQIPSNVKLDNSNESNVVSYGGLVGRVDPTLWFVIGVCNYVNKIADRLFKKEMKTPLRRCLSLLKAWEFNGRGLLYIPQGGDWADEFILSGYVLYDQLLYVWALRCFAKIYNDKDVQKRSFDLSSLIRINYWPESNLQHREQLTHPRAYENFIEDYPNAQYWLPAFNPGGYYDLFDTFSNALAVILDIGGKNQAELVLEHAQLFQKKSYINLLPAFWPPIKEGHLLWGQLTTNFRYEFKNHPYEYHNGGIWPIINAWWGIALVKAGKLDSAETILEKIIRLNKKGDKKNSDWNFYEYFHAQTGHYGGTKYLSWSAAGVILLYAAIQNNFLFFGD